MRGGGLGVGVLLALLAPGAIAQGTSPAVTDAAPEPASTAVTLRCGGVFIAAGASRTAVEAACGEPRSRYHVDAAGRPLAAGSAPSGPVRETWIYHGEWSQFPRLLAFEGEVLQRIERLEALRDEPPRESR